MSLLLPALGVSALWYGGAVALDWKQMAQTKVRNSQLDDSRADAPYWGPTGHIQDRFFADTRGRFVAVREDVDELGARIFLVDYGNGQEVIQYVHPAVLL